MRDHRVGVSLRQKRIEPDTYSDSRYLPRRIFGRNNSGDKALAKSECEDIPTLPRECERCHGAATADTYMTVGTRTRTLNFLHLRRMIKNMYNRDVCPPVS